MNQSNPLIAGIYKLFDMLLLSVLWIAFCIPVVTAGASTTALYYTVQKTLKHERGGIWQCFWDSFRENFRQATLLTLILLAVAVFFGADIRIMQGFSGGGHGAEGLVYLFELLEALLAVFAFWSFAYLARFQNGLRDTMRNALMMALMHFPVTILLLLVGAAAVLFVWIVPFLILLIPAAAVLLMSVLTERVFRKYMSEDDRRLEDERNRSWGEE